MIDSEVDPEARRGAAVVATGLGGLGVVAVPVREPLYRALAETGAGASPWARGVVELTAGRGLLVLVATAIAMTVVVVLRSERERFLLAAGAGAGAVLAYGASELLKTLVTEERPCRTVAIGTVLGCPARGDWSWPSNHATIAAALATACVLVMPRLWPLVVPVAAAIGLTRVLGGVHYPHDVLAGAALGVGVTTLAGLLAVATSRRRAGDTRPRRARMRDSAR